MQALINTSFEEHYRRCLELNMNIGRIQKKAEDEMFYADFLWDYPCWTRVKEELIGGWDSIGFRIGQ